MNSVGAVVVCTALQTGNLWTDTPFKGVSVHKLGAGTDQVVPTGSHPPRSSACEVPELGKLSHSSPLPPRGAGPTGSPQPAVGVALPVAVAVIVAPAVVGSGV